MTPLFRHLPALTALAAPAMILFSCAKPAATPAGGAADSAAAAVPVRVVEVQPLPYTERLQIAGVVKAYDDVYLSTEEGGIIREWKARKGQVVTKGEVIALLKDDVLHPSFLAARAQYLTADMNYQKQAKVYQEQGISEMAYKSAEYARDAAKAQADIAQARWDRTSVKSPVNGVLDDHLVDEGEMSAPGVPIARIVNIDRVRVQINVPERYAGALTRGTPFSFTVLAYPKELFRGVLWHVGSTVSADNRTLVVEGVVANPGHKLKPEMIAKSEIAQAVARRAIFVPEESVVQMDQGLQVVFLAVTGKAVQRRVTLGERSKGRIEIALGLEPGDTLVIDGAGRLVDGQPLTIAQ